MAAGEGGRFGRDPFTLLALVVAALALLELFAAGLLSRPEYAFNDLLLRHAAEQRMPDGQSVIVDIDERSLEAMATKTAPAPSPSRAKPMIR